MILVVLLSRKFSVNPDNVATPIAASLGDLITLSLLACFSEVGIRLFSSTGHLQYWYTIVFLSHLLSIMHNNCWELWLRLFCYFCMLSVELYQQPEMFLYWRA